MASGSLALVSSEFFQGRQTVNFCIRKLPLLRAAFIALPLHVTSYSSSNHVRPVVSLIYPQLWMKVDAKWFHGMTSSRPFRSFTKQDSEQIIRYTHSVSIAVLVNYQVNPIAFLS